MQTYTLGMKETFGIIDISLMPIYLILFYFLAKYLIKDIVDKQLKKIYYTALWLRMAGAILYTLLVLFYYGYGDSLTYFNGGNYLIEEALSGGTGLKIFAYNGDEVYTLYMATKGDIGMAGYFGIDSNLTIMKISAALSLVSFNRIIIIAMFCGFYSFIGQWLLFKIFNKVLKYKHQTLLAWLTLFSPSLWFWASGLLKDSISIGALGIIVYYTYSYATGERKSWYGIGFTALSLLLLYIIKSYIVFAAMGGLAIGSIVWIFLRIKNIILKLTLLSTVFIFFALMLFVFDVEQIIKAPIEEAKLNFESMQVHYQNAQQTDESSKGNLSMPSLDFSGFGIVKAAGNAIVTTLYRPFIWEAKSAFMLFSAIECFLFLLFSIYLFIRTKFFGLGLYLVNNSFVTFCLFTSIFLAVLIGLTTYNFGTIIRYKTILQPLYYFFLTYQYSTFKKSSATNNV